MGPRGWRRALVLGGTRSGKSQFAEGLLAGEKAVRYVATGWRDTGDAEWDRRIEVHRDRRPTDWTTVEVDTDPWQLPAVLNAAQAGQVLLVDELGTWVGSMLGLGVAEPSAVQRAVTDLATAITQCAATVVLVSPEVGLAPVAMTPAGRAFVDALGTTNIAVAQACDVVTLVVAGIPIRVKGDL
jgi:adenosyl cobinamide kinase/adenosyl cobinamide phosphate guanylyltransferase